MAKKITIENKTEETPEPLLEEGNVATDIVPDPPVETATAAVADPRDEALAKLQAERDALFDRLARLQAEFDNFRKRAKKEQSDFRDYAMNDLLKSMLPVVDNFDLALRAGKQAEEDRRFFDRRKDDLRPGIELIRKQVDDLLARFGVKPVAAVGEKFDPHVHEAIEMVESKDAKDNHVIEELQRGYRIKERLLRPAMVKVARNSKH